MTSRRERVGRVTCVSDVVRVWFVVVLPCRCDASTVDGFKKAPPQSASPLTRFAL